MSDYMFSQLQAYGSLLEDAQNPLTVSDVISRARHIQTLPDDQPATGAGTTKRRARALVFAAGLVLLVVVSILLASLQTEVPPAGSTIPGPEIPTTVPGPELPTTVPTSVSGSMWPQSSLEEVREAQELADAGDPDYTWQLDATLADFGEPWGAEIFARFIEEELGWEDSSGFGGGEGVRNYAYGGGGGVLTEVVFIRCAPGQTNPLNPLYVDAPPEIRGCAPTIDELSYETVMLDVSQPGRRGPSGIWVVDRWEMLQPVDPVSLGEFLSPDFSGRQVEQVVPPSEAEVTALLEAFLRARVDGEGAEQYLLREPEELFSDSEEVPLLYATTSGEPYERSEIEMVQGPVWPNGWMEYKVRLFAEGGTVVEQLFHVVRYDGQLGLVYGVNDYVNLPTTENGQSVAVPYSILDGEVTFAAAPPWEKRDRLESSGTYMRFGGFATVGEESGEEHVVIATDPLPAVTDCESDSAPADAEALARKIMADPNSETTGTVPVRIAGLDGLQMDVDVDDYSCWGAWTPDQLDRWRTRLYLIDYPGSSAQILMIAVIADEEVFERALEEATPIVESLEIHAR